MLEDSLLSETVDRDTYKSKSVELRAAIENIDTELTNLESNRNFDFFDVLEEILALTRNIPKTYKEAPDFLKKKYLNLFFDQIQVNDKKIENTVFSPLITVLIEQQKVILRSNWLPNSAVILYQLFPHDLMEQMRIKLEMLKELLGSESQYETVEVKNGQFCRYSV